MFRGLLRKESHAEFDLPDEAEQADVIYIDDMDSPDSVTSYVLISAKDRAASHNLRLWLVTEVTE